MSTARFDKRPRSHTIVLVANVLVAATLIVVGVAVVWANNKVGERLVVNIDGASPATPGATTSEGSPVEEWNLDTSGLRAENFLLTGSDNGACPDKGDGTAGGIGDRTSFGERSDTIMVLRVDPAVNDVAVLSFPRDLWVNIGDSDNTERINVAYREGAPVVVRTVTRALGIPIHHYLEIDFQGFKDLVDAVGGVTVCVEYPTRDRNTGLYIRPGCKNLNGVQSLAYARSRYFEEKIDGQWKVDGTSDIGRGKRQRLFTALLMQTAVNRTLGDPFRAGRIMQGATSALLVDERLDMVEFAQLMRPAATGKLRRFALDTYGDTVRGNSVLRLAGSSAAVLAFYSGTGPAPVPPE